MNKRSLTKRDICTKFILPAVKRAGWDEMKHLLDVGLGAFIRHVSYNSGRLVLHQPTSR
jgi:hypothetical protein